MAGDRTQSVIDAIDGALDDWTVSGDAMRWTPEPTQPPSSPRVESMAVSFAPLRQPRQNGRGSMHTTSPVYFEWSAGLPPMTPWQRQVADVVLQPDRAGDMTPLVAITLPRRFGRSSLMAALAHTHVQAMRDVAERLGRSMAASADEVEQLLVTLGDLGPPVHDQPDEEDPRARALRLRRQRGTGPGRVLAGQQKRPRSLA